MYLNRFLQSLGLLRKPEYIDTAIYPDCAAEGIVYSGYEEYCDAGGNKRCLLHYCVKNDLLNDNTVDITERWLYLQRLDEEPIDLKNAIDEDEIRIALLEALWLFDVISAYDIPYASIDHAGSITTVYAAAKCYGSAESSNLFGFGNNVFRRDLVYSQARYFVKCYIKALPSYDELKAELDTKELFDEAFKRALSEYYPKESIHGNKSIRITGVSNSELDDFIEQMENIFSA